MLQLKEKEIEKFLAHDLDKYLTQIEETCTLTEDINIKEGVRSILHDIFSAGFDCGVKTAAKLLNKAIEVLEGEKT